MERSQATLPLIDWLSLAPGGNSVLLSSVIVPSAPLVSVPRSSRPIRGAFGDDAPSTDPSPHVAIRDEIPCAVQSQSVQVQNP